LAQEIKSMIADERIALIQVKVERAKKHVVDLESAVRAFLDSGPYKVGTKRDPQTRKLIYYLTNVQYVPVEVASIAGDAIHNLRSVLDYVAQQLFLLGPNRAAGPASHDYFPIGNDAADYKSKLDGIVKDLRPNAVKVLRGIEPYKGGKWHELWVLHRLDIIDKHRLFVTVGSALHSVNVGAHMQAAMEKAERKHIDEGGAIPPWGNDFSLQPKINLFLRPADNMFPLKAGNELFIDAVDAEPNEKMDFGFSVALSEPGIVDGKPLLETIYQLAQLVGNTFLILKPSLV
jgi:hypothetical protein